MSSQDLMFVYFVIIIGVFTKKFLVRLTKKLFRAFETSKLVRTQFGALDKLLLKLRNHLENNSVHLLHRIISLLQMIT